jgi:glycosyltransferase involved in cell wall biosynthesis
MFSVLMPAYNAERYIRPAVESILAQTCRDFEFIVVDDGSEDATPAILAEYAEAGQLRLLEGPHEGGGAAMNLAARHASRPWLAVMHADDEALPERLERQREAILQEPSAVVWGTHGFHINETGRVLGLSRFGPTSVQAFERDWAEGRDVNVLHPSAVLRRDVFERVGGYNNRFRNTEDIELFMRMAHHGPVLTLPEPLMRYRLHDGSNTMNRFALQCEEMRFIRARRQAELANRSYDWEQHEASLKRRGLPARLAYWRTDRGEYHWRFAATRMGQRRLPSAFAGLGVCFLLHPRYTGRKLWRQLLSPEARGLLRTADP